MNFTVFSHASSFYGAPQSIFLLTNELKRLGHQVNYVLPDSDGLLYEKLIENNYTVTILPNPSWIISERKPGYSKWLYFKHKAKRRIELITKFVKSFNTYKRLFKKHNTDYIIVNTSVSPYGLILGKLFKIKTILFVREPLGSDREWMIPLNLPRLVIKRILKLSHKVFGPSNYILNYFDNSFNLKKSCKLYNPIVLESLLNYEFKTITNTNIFSFGLVGSISSRKGQIDFIKEFINYENYIVHIFGLGNQNIINQLKNHQDLYPSRILLHGYETKSINIYSKFSIYVNLGKLETFGRTTIEAMSFGCIVFGRRSGATPELINHGVNGFLFDEINEIFEILNGYHSDGRHEELKTIQSNAVEFSKEFSSEKITQEFLLLLNSKSVISQNKSK